MAEGDQTLLRDRLLRQGGGDTDTTAKTEDGGDPTVDAGALRDDGAGADQSDESGAADADPDGDGDHAYYDESGVLHVHYSDGGTYVDGTGVYHVDDDGTWTVTTPDNETNEYHRSDDGTWTDEDGNEVTDPDTVAALDNSYETHEQAQDADDDDGTIHTGDGDQLDDSSIDNVGSAGGDIQTGDGINQSDVDVDIDDVNQPDVDDDDTPADPGVPVSPAAALRGRVDLRVDDGGPRVDPDDAHRFDALKGPQADPGSGGGLAFGRGAIEPHTDDAPDAGGFGSGAATLSSDDLEADQGFGVDLDTTFEPVGLNVNGPAGAELADAELDSFDAPDGELTTVPDAPVDDAADGPDAVDPID